MIKNYMFLVFFLGGSFSLQAHNTFASEDSNAKNPSLFDPLRITEVFSKSVGSSIDLIELTVSGTVTSETGEAMPGVNVLEKGTTNGAVSDSNGKYVLTVSSGQAILVFSFIGYTTTEVSVNDRTTIDLSLEPDLTTLQEVVVVGYGTQEKRDVTGATSSVKADEIRKRPLTRVEQALQGTTAGVVVVSNSGQPGKPLSVKIRGANSLTGGNEPLYVIDGYIGGNIESINPNDIQSIEILKDASSTAIYGSRGSNGVVMITTKSGSKGPARVNFNMWFSKASVPKQLDLMNAYDYARTVNAQFAATGQAAAFTDAQLQEFRTNGGTDWHKELQQEPWVQNYQLDLSGGSENVNYLFSVNHLDQPGLIVNQYYKRTTFRTNIDTKINDKLSLNLKVVALMPKSRNTNYEGDLTDPFSEANIWAPTSPVRDPVSGRFIKFSSYGSNGFNPVAQATNQLDDNRTTNLTGIGSLTYRIFKDLTFTSTNSYEIQSQLTQNLRGPETSSGSSGSDYAQTESRRYRVYQNSNFLTYNHNFGDHGITITALYEQQNRLNEMTGGRSTNLTSYALGYSNLGLGRTQSTYSQYWADALESYMGRVNYSYKDKYLLTASVRTDGSSHLIDKYSTFPSVAAAWNLTKESFLQNSNLFSDLKLRASWGQTGNQAVGAYATIAQIVIDQNQSRYYYDGTTASVATRLGAPVSKTLKWETKEEIDFGIDASFLAGRLTFTADFYKKDISDLLYRKPSPMYNSGETYQVNLGSIENKGMEFALQGIPISTNALKWNTFFTISFNKNKIVDLGGLDNQTGDNIGSAQNGVTLLRVGRPIAEFYGYQFLGTWKTSEATEAALYKMKPGDAKYTDVNGDFIYNSSDLMAIGNGTPTYSFGFINDVTFSNFTVSFMFQGTHGNDVYSQSLAYTWGGQGQAKNATNAEALNIWTPENETDNPAFSNSSKNFINSSRYVYDGSYIKLKNISLAYNIPTTLLSKAKLRSLEVYVSAQNILWITDYPGYDPEVTNPRQDNALAQGLEMGTIPNPRTYTMGLRVGF